jgi:hypothetical protein
MKYARGRKRPWDVAYSGGVDLRSINDPAPLSPVPISSAFSSARTRAGTAEARRHHRGLPKMSDKFLSSLKRPGFYGSAGNSSAKFASYEIPSAISRF